MLSILLTLSLSAAPAPSTRVVAGGDELSFFVATERSLWAYTRDDGWRQVRDDGKPGIEVPRACPGSPWSVDVITRDDRHALWSCDKPGGVDTSLVELATGKTLKQARLLPGEQTAVMYSSLDSKHVLLRLSLDNEPLPWRVVKLPSLTFVPAKYSPSSELSSTMIQVLPLADGWAVSDGRERLEVVGVNGKVLRSHRFVDIVPGDKWCVFDQGRALVWMKNVIVDGTSASDIITLDAKTFLQRGSERVTGNGDLLCAGSHVLWAPWDAPKVHVLDARGRFIPQSIPAPPNGVGVHHQSSGRRAVIMAKPDRVDLVTFAE